ncbi:MAG: hypothetical protein ACQKBU_00040 [Verrucomicrobiales bacterium]
MNKGIEMMNTKEKIPPFCEGVRWVVIDLETTGLDPEEHGVIEIAAKTDDGGVFELNCAPNGTSAELEALAVNGRLGSLADGPDSVEEIAAGYRLGVLQATTGRVIPQREAVVRLLKWLMEQNPSGRWTLVNRNPKFDLGFLRASSGLTRRVIDPEVVDLHDLVRAEMVRMGIRPARFTTNERYAILGFPPEPLPHTALNGVEAAHCVASRFLGRKEVQG